MAAPASFNTRSYMLQEQAGSNTGSSSSSTTPLLPEVLALVLNRLDQRERLKHCARVCKAWKKAAVLATDSISVGNAASSSNLSDWLEKHSEDTGVDSITVAGYGRYSHKQSRLLRLSVQQAGRLRKLELLPAIAVKLQGAGQQDDQKTEGAVLPPQLSGLTHLALHACAMDLNNLPAFTNLQHLVLTPNDRGADQSLNDNSSMLGLALPNMQHLTHLSLKGKYSQDAALAAGVQHLSSLQVLLLEDCCCSSSTLAALPASLTRLRVQQDRTRRDAQLLVLLDGTRQSRLSISAAAFTTLTALQELSVSGLQSVDTAALAACSSLRSLSVSDTTLARTAGGAGLQGFSVLTRLQHLHLCCGADASLAPVGAAGYAALVASTQLTYLNLQGELVAGADYRHVFNLKTKRLPHLAELHASMALLSDNIPVAMAWLCPALRTLNVPRAPQDGVEFFWFEHHLEDLVCFEHLDVLKMELSVVDGMDHMSWNALDGLRQVKQLSLGVLHWRDFCDIVRLTSLRQLTRLEARVGDLEIYVPNLAPAGEPPNVWSQLPNQALNVASAQFRHAMPDYAATDEEEKHQAASALSSIAAAHSQYVQQVQVAQLQAAQEQHQQEVEALKAALEVAQQQQQEQQKRHTQDVSELKAAMEAMAAQMLALQQQVRQ